MGGTTPFTIITGGYWHYQKVSSLRESKKRSTHQHYVKKKVVHFYQLLFVQLFISILFVFSVCIRLKKTKIKLIILREY